jgi:Carboxypeptidase regulatory-like domain
MALRFSFFRAAIMLMRRFFPEEQRSMTFANPHLGLARHRLLVCIARLLFGLSPAALLSQQAPPAATVQPEAPIPTQAEAVSAASIVGTVTDTDKAAVAAARVTLEEADTAKAIAGIASDGDGAFTFPSVAPGNYIVKIAASGFASWKIKDVIVLHQGENFVIPPVELGVEAITTSVNAITMEDLAEQQITVEEHQRILGILPNFFVSYVPNAAPLTTRQKFKLAVVVSRDPVTFFTTGVTAGIEQWQGDFSGYGQEFSGYAKRYAASYGDRLSSTFLGAALLPSLLHQDPRYFYRGHGKIIVRALYAISTVAVCKGDNGHWQPNYSNIGGNLGAAFISSLYYPASDQHSVQVTVTNTMIGVGTGAFGVLFQEFLLRHLTHGVPKNP